MVPDWLSVGWKVWSDPEMSFGRDYFLPMPKPDWTGACRRMAEYADSAGLSVQWLRRLCVPRRQRLQMVAVREPAAPLQCGRCLLERTLGAELVQQPASLYRGELAGSLLA